jgi:hypothetical protein
MSPDISERSFEEAIKEALLAGGPDGGPAGAPGEAVCGRRIQGLPLTNSNLYVTVGP